MRRTVGLTAIALLAVLGAVRAEAGSLRIAVASNFAAPIRVLASRFEAESGHTVTLSFGSTGKHYAQIRHGAPFDAFFAADSERPARLEREARIVPGSRFTYAVGRLALWSPQPGYVDSTGRVLEEGAFHRLAIANPRLAPYGAAAREVLEALGLWQRLSGRMVRGENIGQTFHFVRSGSAELGFVAYAQIRQPDRPVTGSWWRVPAELHTPIEQQVVLLHDTPTGRAFLAFVKSETAQALIRAFGYDLPAP